MDHYSRNFWESLGIDEKLSSDWDSYAGFGTERFNLLLLLFVFGHSYNAVSKLHGKVTRKMWQVLWPDKQEEQVPIISVTNGVHLPSWQAPEISALCDKYIGSELAAKTRRERILEMLCEDISDEELWLMRQALKTRLINTIQDRAQQRWTQNAVTTQQVIAMGSLLDPYALTIAFARRFTEYKRPYLLLSDIERSKTDNNKSRATRADNLRRQISSRRLPVKAAS